MADRALLISNDAAGNALKAALTSSLNGSASLVSGYNAINAYIQANSDAAAALGGPTTFWYQNAPQINGNDPTSQSNAFIRTVTTTGLSYGGLPSSPAVLQQTSDNIARAVIGDIALTGMIQPVQALINNDITQSLASGQTLGGWGGAAYYWNYLAPDTLTTQPGQQAGETIGQYIMNNPVEEDKFITANANANVAALGAQSIPIAATPEDDPALANFAYNLGVGTSIVSKEAVPLDIQFAIAAKTVEIAFGISPVGSPDVINGYVYSGKDANGNGIWFSFSSSDTSGVPINLQPADMKTAMDLDKIQAARQGADQSDALGGDENQRIDLEASPTGTTQVTQESNGDVVVTKQQDNEGTPLQVDLTVTAYAPSTTSAGGPNYTNGGSVSSQPPNGSNPGSVTATSPSGASLTLPVQPGQPPQLGANGSGGVSATLQTGSSSTTIGLQQQPDGTYRLALTTPNGTTLLTDAEANSFLADGSSGAELGGEVAQLIASGSPLAQVGVSTVFSTAGQLIGQEIAASNLGATDLSPSIFETDFAQNASGALGGFAGGEVGGLIFKDLGIDPQIGGIIGGTIGSAVALTATAELSQEFDLGLDLSTNILENLQSGLAGAGVALVEDVTGLSNLNAFGGSPQDAEIGSEVGGLVGGVIGSIIPGVGTFIGSTVGQFLGQILGSVFGEMSAGPNADAVVSIDMSPAQDGKAFTYAVGSDNNATQAMIDVITGLAQSVTATLNAEAGILAGGNANVGTSFTINGQTPIQIQLNAKGDLLNSNATVQNLKGDTTNYSSRDFGPASSAAVYQEALSDSIMRTLSSVTFTGGDPILVAALQNSLLSYDSQYQSDAIDGSTPSTETINEVNYDLQSVYDYNLYTQNKVAFLVGFAGRIASSNQSDTAAALQAGTSFSPVDPTAALNSELARGALLQRAWSYTRGQGALTINNYAASNEGNEGLLVFSPGISQSDLTLSRSGNDLVLSVKGNAGDSVTVSDAFADPQHSLSEIQFTDQTGAASSVLFGQELVDAFPIGFNGPLPVADIEFITDTTARTESHSDTSSIVHTDNAHLTLTGDGNTIVLTGSNGYLNLTGANEVVHGNGNNDQVYVSDSQGGNLMLDGDQITAIVDGNDTDVNLNGTVGSVGAYGNGNLVTANGTGTSVTVYGAQNVVTADAGVITVGEGTAGLLIAGVDSNIAIGIYTDGILIQANKETVTLSGEEVSNGQTAVDITGINGDTVAVNGVEVDGNDTTFTDTGENNTVLLTGNDLVDTLDGIGGNTTLDVDTATVALAGSSNLVTLNGTASVIDVSGMSNVVSTAGNTINVADGTGSVSLMGGGNSINLGSNLTDANIASSGGDTIDLSGNNSVLSAGDSSATASITGSDNNVTLNGERNTVTISGDANTVDASGSYDHISVAGQGQVLLTDGSTVSVAAGAQVNINGNLQDFSDSNGDIVNLGAGATVAIIGGNNWVTTTGDDMVAVTGPGNGVGGSGTGNTVTLAGSGNTFDNEDYTQLNSSTITLEAGGQAALTGNGNQITVDGGATASILGAGNIVDGNGANLSFEQPAGPPAGSAPLAVRGFAFPAAQSTDFNNPTATTSLNALQATGANAVELVATQYLYTPGLPDNEAYTINSDVPEMTDANGNVISPADQTVSDNDLIVQIQQAEAAGKQVLLKPHIDDADGKTWRALQEPSNIAQFFANYQTFIVHYALIAQKYGVQTFSIGCELQSLTGQQNLPYWTQIIQAVRQVYSGQLTYASATYEIGTVSFWNQLDIIGTDAYERTSSLLQPTEAQLQAGWTQPIPTTVNPITSESATKTDSFTYNGVNVSPIAEYEDISEQYNKPVLITEAGYASVNETDLLEGDGSRNVTTYQDFQQQSNAYQALLTALMQNNSVLPGQTSPWLDGAYLWYWNPDPGGVTTDDSSIQGKPAQSVVTAFYTPVTGSSPISNTVTGNSDSISVADGQNLIYSGNSNTVNMLGSGQVVDAAGSGANTLYASTSLSSADVIYAGESDQVYAGAGGVSVIGGAGVDTIHGGTGAAVVDLTPTSAAVVFGPQAGGSMTVFGSPQGNDTINGGAGIIVIGLDAGPDQINLSTGSATIYAGTGPEQFSLSGQASGRTDYIPFYNPDIDSFALGSGLSVVQRGTGSDGWAAVTLNDGTSLDFAGVSDPNAIGFTAVSPPATNQVINVGPGNSIVTAQAGDVVYGGTGSATIYGASAGGSTVWGGGGRSVMVGTGAGDVFYAGTSGDSIAAGAGNETVYGAEAGTSSTIVGGLGMTSIFSQGGVDNVTTRSGDTYVQAGAGLETVSVGAGQATVQGASGVLTVWGGAGPATVMGGGGGGLITAGNGAGDVVQAGSGNVTLGGSGTNGVLNGPTVPGSVSGGAQLFAGSGSDVIYAGEGDQIYAGSGSASIIGGPGIETIHGGTGNATVSLSSTAVVFGPQAGGAMTVFGSPNGNDTINGGAGTLNIGLGGGSDQVNLSTGSATVFANSGPEQFTLSGQVAGRTDYIPFYNPNVDTFTLGSGLSVAQRGTGSDGWADVTLNDGTNVDFAGVGDPNSIAVTSASAPAANQVVNLGSGNTTVAAQAGDTVNSGSGNATIFGASSGASSTIVGGSGTISIVSQGGTDDITTSTGSGYVQAGAGLETVSIGAGHTTVQGASGVLTVWGGAGPETVMGGTGGGLITAGNGAGDVVQAGSGNVTLGGSGTNAGFNGPTVPGSVSGGAQLIAGSGSDVIYAGESDQVYAGSGNASIIGGPGIETIHGATGNATVNLTSTSVVFGPQAGGAMTVFGSPNGNDTINGGAGTLNIALGAGTDQINLSIGSATVYANSGPEQFTLSGQVAGRTDYIPFYNPNVDTFTLGSGLSVAQRGTGGDGWADVTFNDGTSLDFAGVKDPNTIVFR